LVRHGHHTPGKNSKIHHKLLRHLLYTIRTHAIHREIENTINQQNSMHNLRGQQYRLPVRAETIGRLPAPSAGSARIALVGPPSRKQT
jgi:hypothetical protein